MPRHRADTGARDRLTLDVPILQAPMAGVSTPAMATAVNAGGGLGAIALGAGDADAAARMIAETRERTERPFNVNLFVHAPPEPDPARETAWCEALRPAFAAIDSVNTIVNDDGRLTGYNTDYAAVVELIADIDPSTPFVLRGSGGMAKAVAAALRDAGFANGTIVARNEAVGRELAALYGFAWSAELDNGAPLLINVTPIGMTGGDEDQLAFPEAMIDRAEIAFDVVQYPPETRFLSMARGLGKRVITGTQVATIQALEQFVLYTGVRPTPEQVQEAADYAYRMG